MRYDELVKKYEVVENVKQRGCKVWVNGDMYEYRYPAVAKAVAKKVSFFIGVK